MSDFCNSSYPTSSRGAVSGTRLSFDLEVTLKKGQPVKWPMRIRVISFQDGSNATARHCVPRWLHFLPKYG